MLIQQIFWSAVFKGIYLLIFFFGIGIHLIIVHKKKDFNLRKQKEINCPEQYIETILQNSFSNFFSLIIALYRVELWNMIYVADL